MSKWICQETILEQGFPSPTSTTVRVSGNFFYLDTTLIEEACYPSTSPYVFISYGVLHTTASTTEPLLQPIASIMCSIPNFSDRDFILSYNPLNDRG